MQTRKLRFMAFCASCLLMASVAIALAMLGAVSGSSPKAFAMQFTNTPIATSTVGASTYVTPGTLSMEPGAASAPTSIVTLDGTTHTESFAVPISLDDDTGSGAGWDLTLTMTAFTNGSHPALSSDATQIAAQPGETCTGDACTAPTVSGITYPLVFTADGSTSSKIYNATANSGMGNFTITPIFTVTVPATAYAGVYNSTFTVSITSGP